MGWGNNGGWQSGGQGPWGAGPGKQPERPANDLDDILRKGSERFKGFFDNGKGGNGSGGGGGVSPGDSKRIIALAAGLGILFWLASGIYFVEENQQGVVLRFGEYHRSTGPGPNYHLPWPIERVLKPSVTTINKEEIGFRTSTAGRRLQQNSLDKESLMLTSDLNIVDINFEVQWKIDSARTQDYLFNLQDPDGAVKPVAESAMREVIGQMPLDIIITTGQSEIAQKTEILMQEILNSYQAGIEIVNVNLSKPDVPDAVIEAFQDVKKAEQDRETTIAKAEGYRNDIVPRAKGNASRKIEEAEAYKAAVTDRAEGDVARFLSVYEEYRQARDVTRRRMYLETMEEIMSGMEKLIIDESAKGSGVVPYLPLPELQKRQGGQ